MKLLICDYGYDQIEVKLYYYWITAMAAWLYPISSRAKQYYFVRKNRRFKASYEGFRQLFEKGEMREDDWSVYQNFSRIYTGDEVYIYTGDNNYGIIGYAKVVRKDKQESSIVLRFDQQKTFRLLDNPVRAPLIRPFIPPPRRSVIDLEGTESKLQKLLPWSSDGVRIESEVLSPLKLKPLRQVVAHFQTNRKEHSLLHDTILRPVAALLIKGGFKVGGRSFGQLQLDMAAVRDNILLIIEGKKNDVGSDHNVARTGIVSKE